MKPKHYEVEASQCRLLAEGTADPVIKLVLSDMARVWIQLEEQIKKQKQDRATRQVRPERSGKARRIPRRKLLKTLCDIT
jgi:hypothetical protein